MDWFSEFERIATREEGSDSLLVRIIWMLLTGC